MSKKYHPLNETMPETFCRCWNNDSEWEPGLPDCGCGENIKNIDWRWERPRRANRWVDLLEDDKLVVFHPFYSSGTASVKGTMPIKHNFHYYWEVKMMTQPYGTDIMVGLGTQNNAECIRDYTSFLGGSEDSYGLSYTGAICHNSKVTDDCPGFCKGTIVGVMVDMFRGTLEFYLNREPQGISYSDLRRHKILYPMLSSTAALSSMRLIYASSWESSLLINSAKVLGASATGNRFLKNMPPGLAKTMETEFWIPLPSAGEETKRPIREKLLKRRW